MTKTIEFEQTFTPAELVKELIAAGFPEYATLGGIINGKFDTFDTAAEISLDCAVDEDDAIEGLSASAILAAAADLTEEGDERVLEDGLRYVRAGDRGLAVAMFGRLYEGRQLAAVERALS